MDVTSTQALAVVLNHSVTDYLQTAQPLNNYRQLGFNEFHLLAAVMSMAQAHRQFGCDGVDCMTDTLMNHHGLPYDFADRPCDIEAVAHVLADKGFHVTVWCDQSDCMLTLNWVHTPGPVPTHCCEHTRMYISTRPLEAAREPYTVSEFSESDDSEDEEDLLLESSGTESD